MFCFFSNLCVSLYVYYSSFFIYFLFFILFIKPVRSFHSGLVWAAPFSWCRSGLQLQHLQWVDVSKTPVKVQASSLSLYFILKVSNWSSVQQLFCLYVCLAAGWNKTWSDQQVLQNNHIIWCQSVWLKPIRLLNMSNISVCTVVQACIVHFTCDFSHSEEELKFIFRWLKSQY